MSFVYLEDGARFDGVACGAAVAAVGEVVFNTAMSGYQESMTDPSYARQLLTFTYPHIGNYGVSSAAMESSGVHARGAIMRAARNGRSSAGAESGWLDWLTERGVAAIDAIRDNEAVYLMAIGGAAYLVSKAIKHSRLVAFGDLGMEAIYEFDVRDMPVTVAVDSKGTSVHNTGPAEWQKRIAGIPILQ